MIQSNPVKHELKITYTPNEPFAGITSRFVTGKLLEEEEMVMVDFLHQDLLEARELTFTKSGIFITSGDYIEHGNWFQDLIIPPPLESSSFTLNPDDW